MFIIWRKCWLIESFSYSEKKIILIGKTGREVLMNLPKFQIKTKGPNLSYTGLSYT